MNNEQKHKEDLEAAKGWLAIAKKDNNTIAIQILENLFPELRESEDEEWSEEDDVHLTNAILAVEKEWGCNSFTAKWLRTLKNKIQEMQIH